MFPSAVTPGNFSTVLFQTESLVCFGNSLAVSLGTAFFSALFAASAGYAFSLFVFVGKRLIIALMLITRMFPLLMIIAPIHKIVADLGLLTFVSKSSVDWGQMMAAGVLALVLSCLFSIFIQRYLVQGLTSGAVKG